MNNSLSTKRSRSACQLFALAALALATMSGAARAQTVTFYFTQVGSTVPITNFVTTGPGQTINLSVYFQLTQPVPPPTTAYGIAGVNVFVGYDRATTEGGSATPLDNKLTLNGDLTTSSSSAVSNVNATFTSLYFGGQLGGGQPTASGTARPYGDDLFFGTSAGTLFTDSIPTHLFDISLKNVSLSSGSETVSLYNGGTGSDYTTFATPDGATFLRPTTFNLTVTALAAPEPSAVISLLLGTGLLGLQLWRVRRRLRRTVN